MPQDGGSRQGVNGNDHPTTSSSASWHSSALETLPPELLSQIFSHLSFSTLCSVELTSRSLRSSLGKYGWKVWLDHSEEARVSRILEDWRLRKSVTKRDVSLLLKINLSWRHKSIAARQIEFVNLPSPVGAKQQQQNGKNKNKNMSYQMKLRHNLAIPLLQLHSSGLYLAIRSNICFWPSKYLLSSDGLNHSPPIVYQLLTADQSQESMTAWQDVSALQVVSDRLLILGRADGQMQVWRLQDTDGKQQTRHSKLVAKLTLSDDFSPQGTLQCLSYLPNCALVAAAWKNGGVGVFDLQGITQDVQEDDLPTALTPLQHWTLDSRPWSIHLGVHSPSHTDGPDSPWLAVGCQGVDFLFLYRHILRTPPTPISLRVSFPESTSTPPHLSTYALASSRRDANLDTSILPPNHLYAGCYDGMVRVWNVEGTLLPHLDATENPTSTSASPTHLSLPLPNRYIDRYDPSPIYSITLGVGPHSHSIAIGSARHGVVKLFRIDADSQHVKRIEESPNEGASFYPPPPPGDFPTYSIAGEHGRLFCVGQGRVWELDARPRPRPKMTLADGTEGSQKASKQQQYQQKDQREHHVGWYFHGQMELRVSGDRGWQWE